MAETALLLLATTTFAGFFEMPMIAHFFQSAFAVDFFFRRRRALSTGSPFFIESQSRILTSSPQKYAAPLIEAALATSFRMKRAVKLPQPPQVSTRKMLQFGAFAQTIRLRTKGAAAHALCPQP